MVSPSVATEKPKFITNHNGSTMLTILVSVQAKLTDWVKPGDNSGEFKRQASSLRNWISREEGAQFPPEKGRYHIYASYACPWVCFSL